MSKTRKYFREAICRPKNEARDKLVLTALSSSSTLMSSLEPVHIWEELSLYLGDLYPKNYAQGDFYHTMSNKVMIEIVKHLRFNIDKITLEETEKVDLDNLYPLTTENKHLLVGNQYN